MSAPQPPAGPRGPDEPDLPPGAVRPTSWAVVVGWAVAGLVLGWLFHPVAERVAGTAPVVSWFQPAALWLVAIVVATTWWHTWRTVQVQRRRLANHQAVNRLVLARAAVLVGALVAGGYAGYGLSWIGVDAELGRQRILRSGVCVVAGLVIVVGALLLERACRVRPDDQDGDGGGSALDA